MTRVKQLSVFLYLFFLGLVNGFASCRPLDLASRRTRPRQQSQSNLPSLRREKIGSGIHFSRSRLNVRPQDNLVSGVAEIGFAFCLGVLWSEWNIILTGCGPLNFSDTLERVCYQGLIFLAGGALFNRIVTRSSLADTSDEFFGPLNEFTLWQVRVAELASALGVIGAFLALGFQYARGTNMDGLSGIDINLRRALRDL